MRFFTEDIETAEAIRAHADKLISEMGHRNRNFVRFLAGLEAVIICDLEDKPLTREEYVAAQYRWEKTADVEYAKLMAKQQ